MTKSKFSKSKLEIMWYHMNTAKLEVEIAHKLQPEDVRILKSKKEGVYFIVSTEKREDGLPKKIYFRKDFNNFFVK